MEYFSLRAYWRTYYLPCEFPKIYIANTLSDMLLDVILYSREFYFFMSSITKWEYREQCRGTGSKDITNIEKINIKYIDFLDTHNCISNKFKRECTK